MTQIPPPWPAPPPRGRRWNAMDVDDEEAPPPPGEIAPRVGRLPPSPPMRTPQQERRVLQVIEEDRSKAKATPQAQVPLTEEEQKAKKAAKKQRQRENKDKASGSSSSASGAPRVAEVPTIPVYGEVGTEAQASLVRAPAIPVHGEAGAEAGGKTKFRCFGCGTYVTRHTDFLFEHGWRGEFRGKCEACCLGEFNTSEDFHRAAKNSWFKLQQTRKMVHERARMIEFQGVAALVTLHAGGEFSKSKIKALTETSIKRIKAFVAALSAAILEDPVLTKSAKVHTDEYMDTIKRQADDPTHIVTTDGRKLSGESIGYLTYIGGPLGLAVSWLCRD